MVLKLGLISIVILIVQSIYPVIGFCMDRETNIPKNSIIAGVIFPQTPHGDGIDKQIGGHLKYLRRISEYGPLRYYTGANVEYSYIWTADSRTRIEWQRDVIGIMSSHIIEYGVTPWFSFGIGASLGIDIQIYNTGNKVHYTGLFAGNIHSILTFSYKNILFQLEARSFDLFRAYGGVLSIGYAF